MECEHKHFIVYEMYETQSQVARRLREQGGSVPRGSTLTLEVVPAASLKVGRQTAPIFFSF